MKHNLLKMLIIVLVTFVGAVQETFAAYYAGEITMHPGDQVKVNLSDMYAEAMNRFGVGYPYSWWSSNTSICSTTMPQRTYCTIYAKKIGQTTICYSGNYYRDAVIYDIDLYWDVNVVAKAVPITLTASPNGGTIKVGTKVTLTSNPSGADIYYTLDGSTPTSKSKYYPYDGISIDKDCTLKAIAIKEGYANSDVLSATYKVTGALTAKTSEGVEMKFRVTDDVAKTCEVVTSAIDKSTTGKITIPSSVSGYTVNSIAYDAFRDCKSITAVTVPNSVTNIS